MHSFFTSERNNNYTNPETHRFFNCTVYSLTIKVPQIIRLYSALLSGFELIARECKIKTFYRTYAVLKNEFSLSAKEYQHRVGQGEWTKRIETFVPSLVFFNPNKANCSLEYSDDAYILILSKLM